MDVVDILWMGAQIREADAALQVVNQWICTVTRPLLAVELYAGSHHQDVWLPCGLGPLNSPFPDPKTYGIPVPNRNSLSLFSRLLQ